MLSTSGVGVFFPIDANAIALATAVELQPRRTTNLKALTKDRSIADRAGLSSVSIAPRRRVFDSTCLAICDGTRFSSKARGSFAENLA